MPVTSPSRGGMQSGGGVSLGGQSCLAEEIGSPYTLAISPGALSRPQCSLPRQQRANHVDVDSGLEGKKSMANTTLPANTGTGPSEMPFSGTAEVPSEEHPLGEQSAQPALEALATMASACLVISLPTLLWRPAVPAHRPRRSVCLTRACVALNDMLVAASNASVDPCVNLYEHVCGGGSESASVYEKPLSLLVDEQPAKPGSSGERIKNLVVDVKQLCHADDYEDDERAFGDVPAAKRTKQVDSFTAMQCDNESEDEEDVQDEDDDYDDDSADLEIFNAEENDHRLYYKEDEQSDEASTSRSAWRAQSAIRCKTNDAEDLRLEDYVPDQYIGSHRKRYSSSLAITITHSPRSVDITELSGDIIKLVFKGKKFENSEHPEVRPLHGQGHTRRPSCAMSTQRRLQST
ncbi:hypothetical protein HPB49_008907 [Dermacentor silvarum]|uniref:Uncharacterized protein n=1 Tax=Dermacentor silvarum TaxID=543639 RepID=A0ACB8DIZ2_DERSI|nr:uncharacterized protein LOC125941403 [Dermacentor silvarum]KAH7970523.1 hypothetical protein HPB49_008907 [Dermacentor silvarum]